MHFLQVLVLLFLNPTSRLTLTAVPVFVADETQAVQRTLRGARHEANIGRTERPAVCLPPRGHGRFTLPHPLNTLLTLGFPSMVRSQLPLLQTSSTSKDPELQVNTQRAPHLDVSLFSSGRETTQAPAGFQGILDPQISLARTESHVYP